MAVNDSPPVITPDTRVSELLDHYPELEKELLELSPTFKKLQNPILRRTIAKVTTLRHASKVGGVELGALINRLRIAAGQKDEFKDRSGEDEINSGPPSWLVVDQIIQRINVHPMLEAGEKPVARVMGELATMPEGKICELTAPFLPAPMIDLAKEKGFEAWSKEESGGVFKVYFYRNPSIDSSGLVELE